MPFDLSKVTRLYVIGDIHGRSDLLDRMAAAIRHDLGAHPNDQSLTVTLGDYVDRGPDSRGVIERLIQNPFSMPYVAIKGNHEELILRFMADPAVGPLWRNLGGLETLHSYGLAVGSLMMGKGFEEAAQALREAVPESHVKFLSSLKTSLIVGIISCATPASNQASRWNSSGRRTCFGSVKAFSAAEKILAKSSSMGIPPASSRKCCRTVSILIPAPMLPAA
jgi:hypothetical protein